MLNKFERNKKNKHFKLHNPKVFVKDLMKRIICKDLKKKKKIKVSLDWLSTKGAVNPNQLPTGSKVRVFKNMSFTQRHGTEKYSQNVEAMHQFLSLGDRGKKSLSSVYSEKIKDLEYDKLLLKTLERNRITRNNNKFRVGALNEEKSKNEDILDEAIANGVKAQIFQKTTGKYTSTSNG